MAASKTAPTSERRSLKVDKAIIRSIIRGQAGSLEKALMEAVANSMDASASRIDVKVSPKQVVIKDNGKGFAKREDIEKYFGFPDFAVFRHNRIRFLNQRPKMKKDRRHD